MGQQLALNLGHPVPVAVAEPQATASGDGYPCESCHRSDVACFGPGQSLLCQDCNDREWEKLTQKHDVAPANPVKELPPHWRLDAYRGFREWFVKLWSAGYMHGSTLLDTMIEVVGGQYCVEACTADDLLKEAERLGWIIRRESDPTPSQRAITGLQVHGKSYRAWKNSEGVTPAEFHASHWYWSPNRDNADARAWLGDAQ